MRKHKFTALTLFLVFCAVMLWWVRIKAGRDKDSETLAKRSSVQIDSKRGAVPPVPLLAAATATNPLGGGAPPLPPVDPMPSPAATNSPSDTDIEHLAFTHHANLLQVRREIHLYWQELKTNGIPPHSMSWFQKWAMDLYRASLVYGLLTQPANVARSTLYAALLSDTAPRVEMLKQAALPDVTFSRTTNLLSRVTSFSAHSERSEAGWIALEFGHLFAKAKQRSDGIFMTWIRDRMLDPQVSLEEKIALAQRFVDIGDTDLVDLTAPFFRYVRSHENLTQGQQGEVDRLLARIEKMRMP